eukprot:5888466-Lingulodinium_polyedra.AAC.1
MPSNAMRSNTVPLNAVQRDAIKCHASQGNSRPSALRDAVDMHLTRARTPRARSNMERARGVCTRVECAALNYHTARFKAPLRALRIKSRAGRVQMCVAPLHRCALNVRMYATRPDAEC